MALKDWSKVNPAIFGTLFQDSMDAAERHAFGAHYTAEADIQRIVGPTIVRPWTEQIDAASSMKQLLELRTQLSKFEVLDPACGSGNFLYVAYREMAHLDIRILQRIKEAVSPKEFQQQVKSLNVISPKQFHGIDLDGFGVELAKVTLMLAKKLAMDDAREAIGSAYRVSLRYRRRLFHWIISIITSSKGDALFTSWPSVHAIIGNPPYQSKHKRSARASWNPVYENKLRARFPDVDGRADYCTYWFSQGPRLAQTRTACWACRDRIRSRQNSEVAKQAWTTLSTTEGR